MVMPTAAYKETELGQLPREWDVLRLEDVTEFSRKPRNLTVDASTSIPFIPMELISDSSPRLLGWEPRTFGDVSSGSFVRKGDVIIAKITPSFENGKQALLDDLPTEFGYATTEVWALHPDEKKRVISWHLFNYLRMPTVRSDLAGKMEGSTGRQRLPKHVLANLRIPLPPVPEQRKIAAVLGAVQEAKESTEAVIQAAKELKKSLLKYLFTYGPVPVDEAENVPLKETEVGEVAAEWPLRPVGDLFEFSRKPTGLEISKDEVIPFLPMDGLSDSRRTVLYYERKPWGEISSGSFVCKGDLLVAKITPSFENGKQAILDDLPRNFGYATTEVWALHPKDEQVLIRLLSDYLQMPMVRATMAGKMEGSTGRQRLPRHVVANLELPVSPLSVQREMVSAAAALDVKIAAEENKKKAREALFKTLLHDLMTARIRVNHLPLEDLGLEVPA